MGPRGARMGKIWGGLASYIGSALWWLTDKIWGDKLFALVEPMIPEWAVQGVPLSDILRSALAYGPPIALLIVGSVFFLSGRRQHQMNSARRLLGIANGKHNEILKVRARTIRRRIKQPGGAAEIVRRIDRERVAFPEISGFDTRGLTQDQLEKHSAYCAREAELDRSFTEISSIRDTVLAEKGPEGLASEAVLKLRKLEAAMIRMIRSLEK